MRQELIRSALPFALSVTISGGAFAAPGDLLAQRTMWSCTSFPAGVAFDGKVLYYTVMFTPSKIFRVDAATNADLGSFDVKQGGVAIGTGLAGLAFDPSRNSIWVGGDNRAYLVSLSDGEVRNTLYFNEGTGIESVAYDPFLDVLWEHDIDANRELNPWDALGFQVPGWFRAPAKAYGLAFDGSELWAQARVQLPAPAPASPGLIYPFVNKNPDYTRAIPLPSGEYKALAYDCITFGKPAMWVGNNANCTLDAYEISSTAACSIAPAPHLLKLEVASAATRAPLLSKLPLTRDTATFIFRNGPPLDFTDPKPWVLTDPLTPLVVYRWVAGDEGTMGNVLKMVKEPVNSTIIVKH